MGMLQKLKSLLGLEGPTQPERQRESRPSDDRRVATVEREPSSRSEDAVKGTQTQPEPEPESEPADEESVAPEPAGEPVKTITGIGPAYAQRLEQAGVTTVTELAAADATTLAEEIDVSEKRIQGWIDQAAED